MKKLYIASLAILICSFAQAQIHKGDISIGGNLNYSDQGYTTSNPNQVGNKTTALGIDPSLAWAIKDNLLLGFDLGYDRSTNKSEPGYENIGNDFTAGMFIRRYKSIGNGFYLFGQALLSGTYSHVNNTSPQGSGNPNSDVEHGFGFSFGLFPGIAYALDRHWQLETGLPNFFSINYDHTKETATYTGQPDQVNTEHTFSLTSSLSGANEFTVGVRYFIGK